MESIYIDFAGFVFQVNFRNYRHVYFPPKLIREIKFQYKNFLVKERKADFTIDICENLSKKIIKKVSNKEIIFTQLCELIHNKIVTIYEISSWEFQNLLYIALRHVLPKNSSIILHGSAIASKKKAIAFIGKSGAGKSTISKLLCPPYKQVGDDFVLIRKINNKLYCYQLPIMEKIGTNPLISKSFELVKIYILKKSNILQTKKMIKIANFSETISKYAWINYRYSKQQFVFILDLLKNGSVEYLFFPKNRRKLKVWGKTILD